MDVNGGGNDEQCLSQHQSAILDDEAAPGGANLLAHQVEEGSGGGGIVWADNGDALGRRVGEEGASGVEDAAVGGVVGIVAMDEGDQLHLVGAKVVGDGPGAGGGEGVAVPGEDVAPHVSEDVTRHVTMVVALSGTRLVVCLDAVDEGKDGDAGFGTLVAEGVKTFAVDADADLAKAFVVGQRGLDIDQRRTSQCYVEAFAEFL